MKQENNHYGNCKIILNDTYTFDNINYYKGKKYLALKLENKYFLSIGGRFYFLLPKKSFKEVQKELKENSAKIVKVKPLKLIEKSNAYIKGKAALKRLRESRRV